MLFCNCNPPGEGLGSEDIVRHIAQGTSSAPELVKKSGATEGCGTCKTRVDGADGMIREIAGERDKVGKGWPSTDQFTRAVAKLNKYAMTH